MFRILSACTMAVALAFTSELAVFHTDAPSAADTAGARRSYGEPVAMGKGRVRSYVLHDASGRVPVEVGVAIDEAALEGLPKTGSGHHDGHMITHEHILQLPAGHGTPFRFVELNWNPFGHEPDGVYQDVPHFDFHFYTIGKDERDAIMPSDPQFAAKANNVPTGEYVPPFNAALGPPGAPPATIAVPKMGVHWVDVRSPELQKLLGKPEAFKPFTTTFIYGSWDGRYHFLEPMITRAHILAKRTAIDPKVRDEIIPIAVPKRYHVPGYYPSAYRITWDAEAKEYRVALTQLAKQE